MTAVWSDGRILVSRVGGRTGHVPAHIHCTAPSQRPRISALVGTLDHFPAPRPLPCALRVAHPPLLISAPSPLANMQVFFVPATWRRSEPFKPRRKALSWYASNRFPTSHARVHTACDRAFAPSYSPPNLLTYGAFCVAGCVFA